MSTLREWLKGGDLRSDGAADQVVEVVLTDLDLVVEVMEGLDSPSDVVRGRCADVLEKIARQHPELLEPHFNKVVQSLADDPIPMVRWHLAMLLGHLVVLEELHERIYQSLLERLDDDSVFTITWAIVSLCILARSNPAYMQRAARAIRGLSSHSSKAVRAKVRHAIPVLTNPDNPFPPGWIKSSHPQATD